MRRITSHKELKKGMLVLRRDHDNSKMYYTGRKRSELLFSGFHNDRIYSYSIERFDEGVKEAEIIVDPEYEFDKDLKELLNAKE